MKMKFALMLIGLAALTSQGQALRIHLNGVPQLHHRDLSWPRFSGLLQDPWEGLSQAFNGIDVVPQVEELAKAFTDSFFDDPLWPELAGGKGQEIKQSCLDRQASRASEGGHSDKPGGRSHAREQTAAKQKQENSAESLGDWERQQVEQWEREHQQSRSNFERQQQARKEHFLRQLEAEKQARQVQERQKRSEENRAERQREIERQRHEHERQVRLERERAQQRVDQQRAEQQLRLREAREKLEQERQRQQEAHQRLLREAEQHRDEAERRLRDLRESTTKRPLPRQERAVDQQPQPERQQFNPDHAIPAPASPSKRSRPLRMEGDENRLGVPSEILSLYVSGYKPEEVSVKLDGDKVRIQGKHSMNNDESGTLVSEFDRTYTLPKGVDPASIKASFKSGVLRLEGIQRERPALNKSHGVNRRGMEHSSVVTKDNNSYRELRLTNNGLNSRDQQQTDTTVQHSIYRNNSSDQFDDDDVTIEVVE